MKIFLLNSISILLACNLFSQDSAKLILKIRKEVQEINAGISYRIAEPDYKKLNSPSYDGGIQIKGYLSFSDTKEKVRKILEWVGLSYGHIITEYYLKNEKLIFVYQREYTSPYDSSGTSKLDTTILRYEGRFYFDNEILLYSIQNNKKPSTKESYQKQFIESKDLYLKHIPRVNIYKKKKSWPGH